MCPRRHIFLEILSCRTGYTVHPRTRCPLKLVKSYNLSHCAISTLPWMEFTDLTFTMSTNLASLVAKLRITRLHSVSRCSPDYPKLHVPAESEIINQNVSMRPFKIERIRAITRSLCSTVVSCKVTNF